MVGKPTRQKHVPTNTTWNGRAGNTQGTKAKKVTPKFFTGRPGAQWGPSRRRARPWPFPGQADAFAPALWTQFLSLSLPCVLTSHEGAMGGKGRPCLPRRRLPAPSSQPRPYLVVLHVSVGPVFQQQKGRLHVIDGSCPVKRRFSCMEEQSYKQTEE